MAGLNAASGNEVWPPDQNTVLNFRHLLEWHKLGKPLHAAVICYLHRRGINVTVGTIVDATIINAPSSSVTSMPTRFKPDNPRRHKRVTAILGVEVLLRRLRAGIAPQPR